MNTSQNPKHNETSYVCSFNIVLYQYHQKIRTKTKAVMSCINDGPSSAELSKCTYTQRGSALVFATLRFPVMIKSSDPLICESAVKNCLFIGINNGYL